MPDDARISTAIRNHPKTRKLQKRLGKEAVLSLIWLFLYAAESRPDGSLEGMSGEDIELSADWTGEESRFVEALAEVGFLDGETGNYRIHDWFDHNPWAATRPKRIEAAKAANRIRWERDKQAKGIRTESESDATRTKADSPPLLSSPLLTTKSKASASAFVLPDWIDPQTWDDFEEMRKKIRKPLTDRGRREICADLLKLKDKGDNPEAVLARSISRSWQGVFDLPQATALPVKPPEPPNALEAMRSKYGMPQ